MKKVLVFLLILFGLTGCLKRDTMEGASIYTTVYPLEYITSRLYGENGTIKSIYPNGVDPFTYPSLTDKQLADYSEAGLYIFNGLSAEKDYVVPLFEHNKNLKIINASLSMKTSYGNEELWLDPSNFLQLTQNIRNGFEEYISNYYLIEEIKANYDALKLDASKLDANLTVIGTNADFNTIVVTDDLFKFLKKYNINVLSLDKDSLTNKTLNDIKSLMSEKKISYVFARKDEELDENVKALVDEYKVEVVYIHTLSNLTSEERNNGANYLTIMNENIEKLKNELYN